MAVRAAGGGVEEEGVRRGGTGPSPPNISHSSTRTSSSATTRLTPSGDGDSEGAEAG